MKRSTPLRRHKPLQVRSQLRRTPMPPGAARKPRKPPRDTGPSRKVRRLVLARDGHACVCCGRSVIGQLYSLQHRKRRSQGGSSLPSNLITVLGDGTTGCHQRIDSRIDPHDEAKGYTVRSYDDPALVPVMYFERDGSGVSAYLGDDGGLHFEAPAGAHGAPLRHQRRPARPSRCRIWPPATRCQPRDQAGCRPRTSIHGGTHDRP